MIYGDLDKSIPSAFEAEEAGALPASPAHRPLAVKNLQSFKKPEDNATLMDYTPILFPHFDIFSSSRQKILNRTTLNSIGELKEKIE